MKRLYRIVCLSCLLAASLALSGCADALGSVTSLTAVKTDLSMPTIKGVKTVVDRTSVGFEWQPITDKRVEGIDVYRALATGGAQEKYEKIATISNRYATHFVDTSIRPSTTYDYTFKTFGVLFGSAPGQIVRVKTAPPMPAVNLVKAYQPDPGVVKLLWTPHPDPRIVDYVVQRRLESGPWKYLDTVKGRLSPEYVDMSPAKGHRYGYRVIARSADKIQSLPSRSLDVTIH
ncbi:fibronectin type III domain-containing protein [Nitratifractor salsuginis]|uniref:Fibronectin type III domain protein n=1 Tax=Nitratifractor salsuginis (strain DSM 16511 / JCM 12458 / E9I37-1) TaxID=749222 RepID=E6X2P9_NITSE|nr:hypothetical protein [Nitratifractor salsuginis]ADV46115.1 Fibronectin type III domain protein [Nitratifractor salsuginis DSM 16511]